MATTKELLTTIEENQRAQLDRCETCWMHVEKHDSTLYGNGSLGLTSKVAILFWVLGFVGTAAAIAVAGMVKSAVGL